MVKYVASIGFLFLAGCAAPTISEENTPSPGTHLVGFEQAVNGNDWIESEKYLASTVYVILEGSSCCGEKNASDAVRTLKGTYEGITPLTFDTNADVVKEYMAFEKEQNPSGRKMRTEIGHEVDFIDLVIGVENDPNQPNKATIGYKVEDGKITLLFMNGRERTPQATSLPTSCIDQPETKAVITSLSRDSGPVGTNLELRGCNFAGFESDTNAWIENSQGVKGILYGEKGSNAKMMKVTLKSQLCSQDNSYSGLPCSSSLTLTPGNYKIYTIPWGADTKSNVAAFTIQ